MDGFVGVTLKVKSGIPTINCDLRGNHLIEGRKGPLLGFGECNEQTIGQILGRKYR